MIEQGDVWVSPVGTKQVRAGGRWTSFRGPCWQLEDR